MSVTAHRRTNDAPPFWPTASKYAKSRCNSRDLGSMQMSEGKAVNGWVVFCCVVPTRLGYGTAIPREASEDVKNPSLFYLLIDMQRA